MKKILYLLLVFILLVFSIISCCGDGNCAFTNSNIFGGYDIFFDKYYDWCMPFNRNDFDSEIYSRTGKISPTNDGVDQGIVLINNKTGEKEGPYSDIDIKILGSGFVYGKSEWKDWQSEEGRRLRPYIDSSKISNDFNGKFKIIINDDKYIRIVFNDNNNTCIRFVTFFGDWKLDNNFDSNIDGLLYRRYSYDESLWEKEEKDNEFSYSCWLRKVGRSESDFIDGCSDSNRARITIKKLENTDSDNMFGYTLNIQGKNIIDCKMYNYKYKSPNAETNASTTKECIEKVKQYPWAIYCFYRKDIHGNFIESSYFDYLTLTFPVINDLASCSARNSFIYCYNKRFSYLYDMSNCDSLLSWYDKEFSCLYDMSIRSIDEENKTISINIIDEDNCAFADYFTYTYNKDNNKRVINYYKIIDGVPHLVKTIKGDNYNRIFFITNFEEEYRLEHHSLYGKEKNEQGS